MTDTVVRAPHAPGGGTGGMRDEPDGHPGIECPQRC